MPEFFLNCKSQALISLNFFNFVESELNARFTTEDRHEAAQAILVVHNLFDATIEVRKGTFFDANRFSGFENNLRAGLFRTLAYASLDLCDFMIGKRHGVIVSKKFDHARRGIHQMPGFLAHDHFHEHVPGVHAAFGLHLAPIANLFNLFNRQQHFAELILQIGTFDALKDGLLYAFFH